MLQPADGLEFTTNVKFASRVEQVLDGRVSWVVVTENLSSLKNPFDIIVSGAIRVKTSHTRRPRMLSAMK